MKDIVSQCSITLIVNNTVNGLGVFRLVGVIHFRKDYFCTRFTSVCCCVAYLSACSVDILPLEWTTATNNYKSTHRVMYPPFSFFASFLQKIATVRNDPGFLYEQQQGLLVHIVLYVDCL
jgi:hypothetical protein